MVAVSLVVKRFEVLRLINTGTPRATGRWDLRPPGSVSSSTPVSVPNLVNFIWTQEPFKCGCFLESRPLLRCGNGLSCLHT